MKKTNLLLTLFLAFNCLFSTHVLAFVYAPENEIGQMPPPQYKSSKMGIWQLKMAKRHAKVSEPTANLDKIAKQSKTFGVLALVSLAIGALTVLTPGMIVGGIGSILFSLFALERARTIRAAVAPTISQFKKAQQGRIMAFITICLLAISLVLLILFYLTFTL